jgi:hypothetical protein
MGRMKWCRLMVVGELTRASSRLRIAVFQQIDFANRKNGRHVFLQFQGWPNLKPAKLRNTQLTL